MDFHSVITLGHTSKQPLIGPSSELSYGYEPHDLIYWVRAAAVRGGADYRGGAGVYPGWCRLGTWRVVYRVLTQPQDQPQDQYS